MRYGLPQGVPTAREAQEAIEEIRAALGSTDRIYDTDITEAFSIIWRLISHKLQEEEDYAEPDKRTTPPAGARDQG